MTEAEILSKTILRLGRRTDLRLWRQNTGKARAMDDPRRIISFGITGGGDISGIIAPWGTRLEIETKAAKGKQRQSQLAFEGMIRSMGGIYILGHSPDEIEEELDWQLAFRRQHGVCL
jgi:hypothetical protein